MPARKTKQFRLREVAEHNISHGDNRSIWTVIHDKVYDITNLLTEHPGGEEVLIENAAGVDSTENYEDTWPSNDNREMLKDFYIGDLHEDDKTGRKIPMKHFHVLKSKEEDTKEQFSCNIFLSVILIFLLAGGYLIIYPVK